MVRPTLHRLLLSSRPKRPLAHLTNMASKTTATSFSTTPSPLKGLTRNPPPGSWDSHLHVLPPTDRFPLSKDAVYAPSHTAPLEDALSLASSTGVPNLVFTQVSIYGTDNSAQIHAANSLPNGAKGRVVVGMDPDTVSNAQLDQWHAQGVRGVRLNLRSVKSTLSGPEFLAQLEQIISKIKHLDWVLQLHIDLSLVPQLAPLVQKSKVKIVLDHFAGLDRPFTASTDLDATPGWQSLKDLLENNETVYVKLSAPYRIVAPEDTTFSALERPFKQLCALRGGRGVLYASDWPHTRFEERADVRLWVERCLEWCEGDQGLEERLFRDNAERVWS